MSEPSTRRRVPSVYLHAAWLIAGLLAVSRTASARPPAAGPAAQDAGAAAQRIGRDALMKHVEFLASAEMRGRALASPEEKRAAEYVADQLTQAGLKPPAGWESPIQAFERPGGQTAHNVAFALPGVYAQRRDEWVVLGAHLDHLGVRDGQIYHGADDNASGVAGIIEVAKAFAARAEPPQRSLLFCFFTGEESGFVGSRHMVANLPIPKDRIVAMVNADMIGRDDTGLIHVVGQQTAEPLAAIVERANRTIGLRLALDHPEWTYQSDHFVFYREKIPFIYFGVDDHADYHKPTDTADKINRDEIERVSRLVYLTADILAGDEPRPQWRESDELRNPRRAVGGATSQPASGPKP